MSLLVYKISDYSHTAEREQYRTICNLLKQRFSGTPELCVFVANWNVYDSELDGLLIKQDAIIAVEFKNYGGNIIATDNGDWKTDGGVVIQGGVRKSPYKQAKINRSNLLNGLRDSGFIASKNLKHIASLIVFNQPVTVDVTGLSNKTKLWLHICDNQHFIDKIEDITSPKTNFTNQDLIQLIHDLNFDGGGDFLDERFSDNKDIADIRGRTPDIAPIPLTISRLTTSSHLVPSGERMLSVEESTLPAYVGIDFGTSTTVVSVARMRGNDFSYRTVEIAYLTYDGVKGYDEKVATMLAFRHGKLLAGNAAQMFKYDLTKDVDIWYSFKMQLGENLGNQYSKSVFPEIKSPKDATKLFFKYLKTQIERCITAPEYHYAVTIPASFEANQRKDLVEALEANGINVNRQSLIDEPNAAFLSIIIEEQLAGKSIMLRDDSNLNVLVFDYGAGTCDVSVLEVGRYHKGVFSKNLSISRFEKCGGDDIDRCIAARILLPQFLEQVEYKEDLRQSKKSDLIARLMKPAELLKIEICNRVMNQMSEGILPALSNSEDTVTLYSTFNIRFDGRDCSFQNPAMTFKEFNNIMKTFLKQDFAGNDEFNSIFKSIHSALDKSGLDRSDIDYVLLVGGSSYNPYVQYALREYFSESTLRIPKDLQTHVSQGAAIHSLMYNGLGHNIINPISSEPIFIITKGITGRRILFPAGTDMPTEEVEIDDLETIREGQSSIELPICVGDEKKILSNFIISCPEPSGFHMGETVTLKVRLTADKLLKGHVQVRGKIYQIEPINPLSNKSLSPAETTILKAQRAVYDDASAHDGRAGRSSLMSLAKAYESAGKHFEAAETYEDINEIYPNSVSLNEIAIQYSAAGRRDKETELLEQALVQNPYNATIMFNLSLCIKNSDSTRYKELMEKSINISPNDPCHLYDFGCWLRNHNERQRGQDMVDRSLDIWAEKLKNNRMYSWDYSWYASALEDSGNYSKAREVRAMSMKIKENNIYNPENLTKIK